MKIAKAAVILLIGLLLVTAFACGGGSEQGSNPTLTPSPSWATYSNSSLGFSIQYPQDWGKVESQNGSLSIVVFGTGARSDSIYGEGFAISKKPGLSAILSVWVNGTIISLREYAGFNLVESSAATLAGMPAHKFVYTWEDDPYSVKCMEIISVKNNYVYYIEFRTDITTYDSDVTTAQHMLDSFVIY